MATSPETDHPVLPATSARGGRPMRPILYVLLFSTLLAALGLFAAWTWRSGDLKSVEPANNGKQAAAAQAFDAPEPAPAASPTTGAAH